MAFTLGVLHASSYDKFFWGIWAVGVALLLSLLSVVSILISRFSSRPQGAGAFKLSKTFLSVPPAAAAP